MPDHFFHEKELWQNAVANQSMRPERTYYPASLQEIIDCVRDAENRGRHVRAVGSGHGFSDIALTSDYSIRTKSYNRMLALNPLQLRNPAMAASLTNVEAGIELRQLIHEMEMQGRALPNLGSYTGQALIGAVSTSTHGSGIKLGPLPSMVRSIVIVASGGRVFRIEPSNGITNPATYSEPPIELVQNDDWFYSVLVSMGCMGVVYSMIIETLEYYLLIERRDRYIWEQVRPLLAQGKLIGAERHVELLINPYPRSDGTHFCSIVRRRIAPPGTVADPDGRNSIWVKLSNSLPYYSNGVISNIFRHDPESIPGNIDAALGNLVGSYTDRYYKVLSLGVNAVDGYAIEVGYSLDNYLKAVDFIFDLALRKRIESLNAPSSQRYKYYITSPFSLRYVQASRAYLSPMSGRDTCMLEFPFVLFPGVGVTEESKRIMLELQEFSYTIGGRMHWGLEFGNLNADIVSRSYPATNFQKWLAVHRELNASGVFNNAFTQRIVPPGQTGPIV
jgi:hypothetical protein